jgi:hypothetical protein
VKGINRHGQGWRGTFSVSTETYASEQEAMTALADLKARIKALRAPAPEFPSQLREHAYATPPPDPQSDGPSPEWLRVHQPWRI